VYVETDFLIALLKDDDWLQDAAIDALEREDLHTSILSYAEVLVLFYDHDRSEYDIDAPRAVTNLLEVVPVEPARHEDAVLAAATFLDEHDMTPFDALHAGLAATTDAVVLSSETDYDDTGVQRVALETYQD
jgi:predicted nucleic acid-binding protein